MKKLQKILIIFTTLTLILSFSVSCEQTKRPEVVTEEEVVTGETRLEKAEPEDYGTIIIPKDIFPEGNGLPIPIYIPPVTNNSNAFFGDWTNVKEIPGENVRFSNEKLLRNLIMTSPEGVPESSSDASIRIVYWLLKALSEAFEKDGFKITIQKNPQGDLRAVIEISTDEMNVIRVNAGGVISSPDRGIAAVEFSRYLKDKFSLPDGLYQAFWEIDKNHKKDPYVAYMGLRPDKNAVLVVPKIYSRDIFKIMKQTFWIFWGPTVLELRGKEYADVWSYTLPVQAPETLKVLELLPIKEPPDAVVEPEPVEESSTEQRGNTVGNIVNMGLAAKEGDWIYYPSNDGGRIYKIRTDGSERTRLSDDWSRSINVVDGWIYYYGAGDNGYGIYKMRTDGSERTRLSDNQTLWITVVDGWIYYNNWNDDSKIYKMRTDGSERTKLNNERSYDINVVDGWIYYTVHHITHDLDNNSIYKMRTDGSERTKLFSWPSLAQINVVDGWIYYVDVDSYTYARYHGFDWPYKEGIYKTRTDGSGRTQLTEDNPGYFGSINVADGWVYYTNTEDKRRIYKIRTDGSGRTRINDDPSWCVNVVGDWIYYAYYEEFGGDVLADKIYKMRTDGSERQKVD